MNKQIYVLQNQDKYFLSKNNEWVDGRDLKELFKTPHRDIAVNHLFEVNAHDYQQRIHILDCEITGQNMPVIEEADLPPPLPKKAKPEETAHADEDGEELAQASEDTNKGEDTNGEVLPTSSIELSETRSNLQENEKVRNPEGELLVQEV